MSQVDVELKEILACPKCGSVKLEWHEDRAEVHCPDCRMKYPIDDGIPVMLLESAKPI